MYKLAALFGFVLSSLFYSSDGFSQNILNLSTSTDLLTIKGGTTVSLDGLVLTSGNDIKLAGPNSLLRNNSIVHASPNPYIKRVYSFANPTSAFSGIITFNYLDNELNNLTEDALVLNIHNGNSWNAYINNAIRDGNANYVTTGSISNVQLSELTLTSFLATLPLTFLRTNILCETGATRIRWTSTSEINILHYSIENSEDARIWKEVGTVNVTNNTGRESEYSFEDYFSNNKKFYRVTAYEMSGRKTFTAVLQSNCIAGDQLSVYPNPVINTATINITATQTAQASVMLFDLKGQLVHVKSVQLLQGANQMPLEMSGMPPGVYTISVILNYQVRTTKIVKK